MKKDTDEGYWAISFWKIYLGFILVGVPWFVVIETMGRAFITEMGVGISGAGYFRILGA